MITSKIPHIFIWDLFPSQKLIMILCKQITGMYDANKFAHLAVIELIGIYLQETKGGVPSEEALM